MPWMDYFVRRHSDTSLKYRMRSSQRDYYKHVLSVEME